MEKNPEEEGGLNDPQVYAAWKKDVTFKLKQLTIFRENVPTVLKRCPKCLNLTLEFDQKTSRLHCIRCGFEEHLKM